MENNKNLSDSSEKEVLKTLQKARIKLLMEYPFFGILSLKLQLNQDYKISTMGTDGIYLYYNPIFIKTMKSDKKLNWCIIHEIMHCALRHISKKRMGTRNPKKWNYACDYAIHGIMAKDNNPTIEMPEDCLYNEEYVNMTAEQIYDLLPDNFDQGSGGLLDVHVWTDSNFNDNEEENNSINEDALIEQWEYNIINAAKVAESNDKSAGSIPGYFKRYINKLTNPQKDWRVLLREIIEPEGNDYTFMRPDNRISFDEFGCFLPSFDEEGDAIKDIIFWIDTSGSIDDRELDIIYSEVAGAIEQFDTFNGYLGFFDHDAYEPKPFDGINSLRNIKPIGGGGTNFEAPFKYMEEHEEFNNAKRIIILTDGYCNFPNENITNIPTIWLITNKDIKSPWGTTIYLPLKEESF